MRSVMRVKTDDETELLVLVAAKPVAEDRTARFAVRRPSAERRRGLLDAGLRHALHDLPLEQ